jgi:hypothetical protein
VSAWRGAGCSSVRSRAGWAGQPPEPRRQPAHLLLLLLLVVVRHHGLLRVGVHHLHRQRGSQAVGQPAPRPTGTCVAGACCTHHARGPPTHRLARRRALPLPLQLDHRPRPVVAPHVVGQLLVRLQRLAGEPQHRALRVQHAGGVLRRGGRRARAASGGSGGGGSRGLVCTAAVPLPPPPPRQCPRPAPSRSPGPARPGPALRPPACPPAPLGPPARGAPDPTRAGPWGSRS